MAVFNSYASHYQVGYIPGMDRLCAVRSISDQRHGWKSFVLCLSLSIYLYTYRVSIHFSPSFCICLFINLSTDIYSIYYLSVDRNWTIYLVIYLFACLFIYVYLCIYRSFYLKGRNMHDVLSKWKVTATEASPGTLLRNHRKHR